MKTVFNVAAHKNFAIEAVVQLRENKYSYVLLLHFVDVSHM